MIVFNGVDVSSGSYLIEPIDDEALAGAIAAAERDAEREAELHQRSLQATDALALPYGADPGRLDETGWGVLFPTDQDPAIRRALEPLLVHRADMAADRYCCYDGEHGYGGETKVEFLRRRTAPQFGPVDPDAVPYYLLIVGSPEEIPFDFQRQLGIQYAIGRLDFDDVGDYEAYVASLLASERGDRSPARVRVVAAHNPGDLATELSATRLAGPLADALERELGPDRVERCIGSDADAGSFVTALTSRGRPTLSFLASHGAGFGPNDPLQRARQGAPIGSTWRGRGHPVERDDYVIEEDLSDPAGLIAFGFACFSGGTPCRDSFRWSGPRDVLAPAPFVSGLAKALLARGALAVVGHIDRAYGYSFVGDHLDTQTKAYESCLRALLDGLPVGAAMEPFAQLCGDFGAQLALELDQVTDYFKRVLPAQVNPRWVAASDAGAFAIAGDPAARLASGM